MKTLKEVLFTLPEPHKTLAIKNTRPAKLNQPYLRTKANAIMDAFVWSESPEGRGFWEVFYNVLVDAEVFHHPNPLADMPVAEPLSEEDVDLMAELDSAKRALMDDYECWKRSDAKRNGVGFSEFRKIMGEIVK